MKKCLVKIVTQVRVKDTLAKSLEEGAGQEEADLESVEEEEEPRAQVCLW